MTNPTHRHSIVAGLDVIVVDNEVGAPMDVCLGATLRKIGEVRLSADSKFWEASAVNTDTTRTHIDDFDVAVNEVVRAALLGAAVNRVNA